MKNLLLIVMFASTPAAAQEFAFDAEALGRILAQTRALKVKHGGRPLPPMVSDCEARHRGVYVNKKYQITQESLEKYFRTPSAV